MGRKEANGQAVADAYVEFIARIFGLPASVARINLALMLSSVPLSQAQLRSMLSLSEGSVSEGLRLLTDMGFVERAGDPRARPAHYQVRAAGWSDPVYNTMENAKSTHAIARLFKQHLEESDVDGPGFELIVRSEAMFKVLVAELPAVMEKALEAGARVRVSRGKRARQRLTDLTID